MSPRGDNVLMVAMRDGVRLATDMHLPDGAGPFPVVLERTPYGRNELSPEGRTSDTA